MPALDALNDRLRAAHTVAIALSVDASFSQAAWAEALGGVSLPIVGDFHPKGEIAESFGAYIDAAGISDRATVIIDAGGKVRYAVGVTPKGKRDIGALVAECEKIDAAWEGELGSDEAPAGLAEGSTLYVRDNCMFSRWALYARRNLHLDRDDALPVRNISEDKAACEELERLGGKAQAPALVAGTEVMYESADIAAFLTKQGSWRWPGV